MFFCHAFVAVAQRSLHHLPGGAEPDRKIFLFSYQYFDPDKRLHNTGEHVPGSRGSLWSRKFSFPAPERWYPRSEKLSQVQTTKKGMSGTARVDRHQGEKPKVRCLPPSGAKRGRGSETMARGSDGISETALS